MLLLVVNWLLPALCIGPTVHRVTTPGTRTSATALCLVPRI
ncbi:unnamed protein product [Penicillium roqueforti FM164]|uniref:Transposable element n=1 Tax=Penicillium roqueforti (strain FM164) TaxID=1365484 RepID=W6QRC7_PENRF|nr:unnamed protein product [Penicillium roqueforti FM164]